MTLPRSWDPALETFLEAPISKSIDSGIIWKDRTVDAILPTKTIVEAINRHIPTEGFNSIEDENIDPLKARENKIRKMIEAPLSPRKPIVIPCPYAAVKQRDKMKLEKIRRKRNRLLDPNKFIPPVNANSSSNSRLVRRFGILDVQARMNTAPGKPTNSFWGV